MADARWLRGVSCLAQAAHIGALNWNVGIPGAGILPEALQEVLAVGCVVLAIH